MNSKDDDTTGLVLSSLVSPTTSTPLESTQPPTKENMEDGSTEKNVEDANVELNFEEPLDDRLPAPHQTNPVGYVSIAEHRKLLAKVDDLTFKFDSYVAKSCVQQQHPVVTTVLKTSAGREYELQSLFYERACLAPTMQAVVKNMALALLSPGESGLALFRCRGELDEELPHDFIVKLKAVCRAALRKKDRHSNNPALRIMKCGENEAVKNKGNGGHNSGISTATMSLEERKVHFSALLTPSRLTHWASLGFADHRRSKKRTQSSQ
nr:PREDICTED: uncharacterized protein LOC105272782 [Fopius arisanus]